MMEIIQELTGLISSKIESVKTVVSLIKLETRLAGLSIYPLILNIVFLLIVLTTFWLSAMLLLGYFFIMALGSTIFAISLIILLNLMLLFFLQYLLKFNLNKMSFEKTREYFSNEGQNEDDKLSKISDVPNCTAGQEIKTSSN